MKQRIFASLAAAAAVAASILITSATPAAAADPTPTLADSNTAARSAKVTPNEGLPLEIQVKPAENLKVVATLLGVGKQVYDCNSTGAWTFREPIAGLFTSRGVPAGIHGATTGPTAPFWANLDGSRVIGNTAAGTPGFVAIDPPAGSPAGVKWLRLPGTQPNPNTTGTFSKVTVVQRIDTRGGLAPTTKCSVPATQAVDYTTNYVFWAPKP